MAENIDQLRRWDCDHVWHPFTQMAEYEPLIIERAEGCTLITSDGRRLLDGVSSLWCNVHGHRHPRLDAAIREQLDRVAHVTSLGQSNPTTIRLARRLVEIAPPGLNHVFFSDSGATAVEVALKMAFQYWQQRPDPRPAKTKYAALANAYHGDTIGSVSVGGVARFHQMFAPLLFDVIRVPAPDQFRRPPGVSRDDALTHYLSGMRQIVEQHHEQLAAFVIEPLIQGAAGMLTHPPGYLRGVRELCDEFDVLLIADEVATGFGRTGRMFACEHESVSPDLLCLAKGLTGGYMPMAATLATDEIYGAFLGEYRESKTFYHGHTYGGNPLAAAVSLASLALFDDEQTLLHLQAKIERLREHLARIAQHANVGDVRQCGFIAGIEMVRSRETNEPFAWEDKRGMRACEVAMRHGVWLRPLGNVIVIMPPLAVTIDELDRICHAAEAGISEATT